MKIHVDGDILLYRCGFAAERMEYKLLIDNLIETYRYKKDLTNRLTSFDPSLDYKVESSRIVEPVENALHNVKNTIAAIKEQVQSDDITVYLSGKSNFRETIATLREYKGHRDPDHKPAHTVAIRNYILENYPAIVSKGEEADDVLGYSHYKLYLVDPYSTIIASTDKDLDMIPGLHFNFVTKEMYNVDEDYALYTFYLQLLQGDPTDNIPGIPGIGPKRAHAYLDKCKLGDEKAYYKITKQLYEDAYKANGLAALRENAQLLWIRRNPNEWWKAPDERE